MSPRLHSWKDLFSASGWRTSLRGAMTYLFGKQGKRRVSSLRLLYRLRTIMILKTSKPLGKLTRGRKIRLWVDGKESFARIEKLLRRAKFGIVIQMFIWRDDDTGRRIAQLLIDAAERGVQVDITKDAVGDFFEFRGDFLGTKHSDLPVWKAFWKHPRIRITYGTQRDHAKVYVIDDQYLLLTGMNIADEYRYHWHDYLVELIGQEYVEQFISRKNPKRYRQDLQLIMNTEQEKEIRAGIMNFIRSAEESIVLEHCYISDPEVIDMLITLSHKGVRVTLMIPKHVDFHHHANLTAVGRLITQGHPTNVRVLVYPDMFHAKAILVDHTKACIGSANLFKSSLDDMGEVNVLIQGRHRALWKLRESLRSSILKSRPLTSPPALLWLSKWLSWLGL